MLQDQKEAATRNQVKCLQDSVVIDFPSRDRNADNTRNIISTRTNRNVVATQKLARNINLKKLHKNNVVTQLSMSQHNYSSQHT